MYFFFFQVKEKCNLFYCIVMLGIQYLVFNFASKLKNLHDRKKKKTIMLFISSLYYVFL